MRVALVAPLVSAIREPQGGGSQASSPISRAGWPVGSRGPRLRGHRIADTRGHGDRHRGRPPVSAATLYRAAGPAARDRAPGGRRALSAFAGVYARVGEDRYDVVHNHAFDAPAIGWPAAGRARRAHPAPAARPGRRGRALRPR